ncbi:MAG: hypothetical protein ACPGYP_01310 [Solirubrobacterales bacterium]
MNLNQRIEIERYLSAPPYSEVSALLERLDGLDLNRVTIKAVLRHAHTDPRMIVQDVQLQTGDPS